MKAEVISIGSELLTPEKLDTNSLYLTEKLNELGIDVHLKTVVGDDELMMRHVIKQALERSDLIISIGGLGPTEDDVTKKVFADALGRKLQLEEAILEGLKQRFARFGMKMPDINVRQAFNIEGATVLENRVGTAPGLWLEPVAGKYIILLPGPPRELKAMFQDAALEKLRAHAGGQRLVKSVLKIAGLTESRTDSLAAPVYTQHKDVRTTILASPGHVELHLSALAPSLDAAKSRLKDLENKLAEVLGDNLYSRQDESLEQVAGAYLSQHKATLSVAESCTGGLIAERITRVPGSSQYFRGGVVCYSDMLKTKLCDIPTDLIQREGAVSAAVAERLAGNIRTICDSTFGLSVVGIAGPDKDAREQPVGLVYIGFSRNGSVYHKRYEFPGDREVIRFLASQYAIDLVRRELL